MSELCAESEARLGLTVVDGRQRGGLPGAGRAEVEAEFVRRLRAAGAIVRPRYCVIRPKADTRSGGFRTPFQSNPDRLPAEADTPT
jgi:hypothetical protein